MRSCMLSLRVVVVEAGAATQHRDNSGILPHPENTCENAYDIALSPPTTPQTAATKGGIQSTHG